MCWGPRPDGGLCPSVRPANPLGILLANVLSPALVKEEDDIPIMVRGLPGAPAYACVLCMHVCVCVVYTRVYMWRVFAVCTHMPAM